MISFWKIVGWIGLGAGIAGMAVAIYIRLSSNGNPWPALVIMAPGVVLYQLAIRMLVREARIRLKK